MRPRSARATCAALALVLAACREAPATLHLVAADATGGGDGTIASDGRRFAISSKRSGRWKLWRFDLERHRWSRLTSGEGDDFEPQWSPDGAEIAFTSTSSGNKDVYVLTIASGAVRRLTTSPDDDEYPSWSPDGRWIVFTGGPWNARQFFLVEARGGTPRAVTRRPGQAGACSFEPDGAALVCHAYDVGSGQLLRIDIANGAVQPLTDGRAWDYKPATSTDGRWTAFSRADEGPTAIWILDRVSNKTRRLTHSGANDSWPSWSASGDRLFFHRVVDAGSSVRVLERFTNRVRTLVDATERPLQASLDPTRRWLVYCAGERGTQRLRVMDIDRRLARTLPTAGEACFPRWSPDGHRIAYVERTPGGNRWEIASIDPDGSHHAQWTTHVPWLKELYGPLDWSPDGSRIVFKSDTRPFESAVLMLDVRTGVLSRLTDDAWWNEAPSWSADGRGILLMSTRGGNWTWGLFELRQDSAATRIFAKPDYVEKNFPRMAGDGSIVWSAYSDSGVEHLVERTLSGDIRTLGAAGPWARWPSYSSDSRLIVYTTVDHYVEYWIAEHPVDSDPPLLPAVANLSRRFTATIRRISMTAGAQPQPPRTSVPPLRPSSPTEVCDQRPLRVRSSPMDLHRR